MIVVMARDTASEDLENVRLRIEGRGLRAQINLGEERAVVGVMGSIPPDFKDEMELMNGVSEVVMVSKPYKLASKEFHPDNTVIKVGDAVIGGPDPVIMAGPCSVEDEEQMVSTAKAVKNAGATVLRGGAFKPRTSPYSFRGMGEDGLKLLNLAKQETGLPIITEVMATADVETVAEYADILQIGARNMQNYNLLDEVGLIGKPVMVKRGLAASYEEWLLAAEYVMAGGNEQVILCERGVRGFETFTRFTLDVAAVPVIKRLSHLPIVCDPSHSTGKWYLVTPVALASVAAGAHGLLIEVHPNPDVAKCDGPQSLTFENFDILMDQVNAVASVRKDPVATG
ncbi:MAG: 3-deoxy-7-phosphoheptulonate synthase [Chloroflexota bacterium]|jgi:3-deoxy-7-phosphoheptulonate synthase|nr:3-deoxy-7-phosphoheptulonate synthase [Dehalococcoidia bacterium]MEC8857014.1 3-deoxy-7-phosphoheptulonate synthase [Chloroflexota bacterium]MEC8910860.1 3-deoxy-7-phosphoheptulonate synthase [Chloroflexota bacterium]MEC8960320.1 3-deoxy-7-phosphoheptulonate synthase [Chloroflexota bacterium]MEC9287645.1 3-deoxy-7-phosphoheptulonate synthase [Chloroflexota bacterium]|tara:strand:+ start:2461 stop:3483 length:1023 start_codon:yes stop_codon:yes gene_type:complete